VPRRPLPDLPQSVSANQNPPNIDIGLEKSLKGAASDYYETPGVDEILIDKSYGYVVNNEVIHNHDGFYSRLFKKTQVKDKLRGSQTQTPGIDEILIDKSYGYVEHNQVNHNPDDIQIDSGYNVSGKKGGKILSDGLYSKLLFKTQTQDKFTGPKTDTLLKDNGNQRDCTLHKTTDNDKDCDKSFNNETLDKLRGNLNTTYYKLKALVENMKDKDKQNDTDTCDNLNTNKDKNGQKDTATDSKTEHNTQNDTDKSQKENLFAKYLKLKLLNKTTADNVADKVDNENNHKDTTDIMTITWDKTAKMKMKLKAKMTMTSRRKTTQNITRRMTMTMTRTITMMMTMTQTMTMTMKMMMTMMKTMTMTMTMTMTIIIVIALVSLSN